MYTHVCMHDASYVYHAQLATCTSYVHVCTPLSGNYNIYEGGLENISKYKLKDLQSLADKNNISLKEGTKNKLKKQLYDELNNIENIIF